MNRFSWQVQTGLSKGAIVAFALCVCMVMAGACASPTATVTPETVNVDGSEVTEEIQNQVNVIREQLTKLGILGEPFVTEQGDVQDVVSAQVDLKNEEVTFIVNQYGVSERGFNAGDSIVVSLDVSSNFGSENVLILTADVGFHDVTNGLTEKLRQSLEGHNYQVSYTNGRAELDYVDENGQEVVIGVASANTGMDWQPTDELSFPGWEFNPGTKSWETVGVETSISPATPEIATATTAPATAVPTETPVPPATATSQPVVPTEVSTTSELDFDSLTKEYLQQLDQNERSLLEGRVSVQTQTNSVYGEFTYVDVPALIIESNASMEYVDPSPDPDVGGNFTLIGLRTAVWNPVSELFEEVFFVVDGSIDGVPAKSVGVAIGDGQSFEAFSTEEVWDQIKPGRPVIFKNVAIGFDTTPNSVLNNSRTQYLSSLPLESLASGKVLFALLTEFQLFQYPPMSRIAFSIQIETQSGQ